ncbi:MAG: SCO family protein [Gammaproteobacteria bacterium]|nr:SCO family protein [Gammaproteobacteria bacterium]NNF59989.1 SCO family protein [Gammaproteobacteria bacterium]NNM21451.1 SCO family protein [Gammaproteobacteria bacterium]
MTTATVFSAPRPLPQATLVDHLGATLTRDSFRNRWDILFFGFTHCPDICPTTLFQLRGLAQGLEDLGQARQPRIWLVSVDPERDTPDILARYIASFSDTFNAATGEIGQIAAFAEGMGVAYSKIPEGDDYTMAHTAALFLVNPQAELVALFSAPHDMRALEADYRALVR